MPHEASRTPQLNEDAAVEWVAVRYVHDDHVLRAVVVHEKGILAQARVRVGLAPRNLQRQDRPAAGAVGGPARKHVPAHKGQGPDPSRPQEIDALH